MESHEYQTLFELEPSYWWFRGLHLILLDTLHALGLESHEPVLDAGCGTGQNLVNIGRQVTSGAYGFDVSSEAAFFCKKRGLTNICRASINDIPFAPDTFAAVVSVDVLECDSVLEDQAYGEIWRVLKPGGYMVSGGSGLSMAYDTGTSQSGSRVSPLFEKQAGSLAQKTLRGSDPHDSPFRIALSGRGRVSPGAPSSGWRFRGSTSIGTRNRCTLRSIAFFSPLLRRKVNSSSWETFRSVVP